MDRLIAPGTVIAAQADTAPATGTPGYATDGDPATGVIATQWPAYQYNALQEELIAFLTAAAVAPDRTKSNQILAACRALFAAVSGSTTQAFSVAAATIASQAPQFSQLGSFWGVTSISSNLTLTASAFGQFFQTANGSAGGFTITLPTAAGNAGKTITFFNASTGNLTLVAGNFNTAFGIGNTSLVMPPDSTVTLECDNVSYNGIGGAAAIGGTVRPQASAGVGQWQPLLLTGTAPNQFITLPAGGTWAYFGFVTTITVSVGVAAGGTNILGPNSFSGAVAGGLCWRIQ